MSKIFLGNEAIKGQLWAICTASTGTNHIDLDLLTKKIKLLSLTKQYKIINQLSLAELAFGLTMNALTNISSSSESVKTGNWNYLPFIGRM